MPEEIHLGQYQGFFQYGPEYGEFVQGQEAEFRLFVEKVNGGEFAGRIIDWAGIGANGEVASVKGFVENGVISFTKQYARLFAIDERGASLDLPDLPGHSVQYEGLFDASSDSFTGSWEIVVAASQEGDYLVEQLVTGTWRMEGGQ